MKIKHLFFTLAIILAFSVSPARAFAADAEVGNEVLDTADGTLTRTGAGTAIDPFKLEVNLANGNTWTGNQTFTGLTTFGSGVATTTITPSGEIFSNENISTNGDLNVNSGNINSTSWSGNIFNTNVGFLNIGGATNVVNIGGNWSTTLIPGTLQINNNLSSFGAVTFSPSFSNDVTINTDSDSTFILNGLNTSTGDPLCLDASNNVVKCASSFSANAKSTADLTATVKAQQKEIDALKQAVKALQARVH